MRYRRADVKGGTYFLTVNLAERKRTILVDHMDVLRTVMKKVKAVHACRIDAMGILPNHVHAMRSLPQGDADYPTRWAWIKAGFSRRRPKDERHIQSLSPKANGESGNGDAGNI